MSESRTNAIRSLSSLYTVVIGVALSVAAVQLVNQSEGISGISLVQLSLFFSLVCTLIPFYHGALRHLDNAYLESPNLHIRDGALILDVLLLIAHGMTFVVLAMLLNLPNQFAWVLVVLIFVDVLWGIFVYYGPSTQKGPSAEGKWALINTVFVLLGGTLLYLLDIRLQPVADPLKIALPIAVICLLRTLIDYGLCWPFYFPPIEESSQEKT